MLKAIERTIFSRARPRQARAAACYQRAALVAAEACGVELREVLSARRRKGAVNEARRLAAYLTVMCFGISRRQVAQITGRNFMRVSRFCAEIEATRDNAATDSRISGLEARLDGILPAVESSGRDIRATMPELYETMRRMWADGRSAPQIGAQAGLSAGAVRSIASRNRHDFPWRAPK